MAAERQLTVRLREYQVMALHRSRSVRASESVSRRSPRWRRGAALSHAGAYVGPYRTAYTRQAGSPPGSPRRADRRLGARFLAMAFRSDVWFLPIARDIEADLMWVPLSFSQHGRRAQIPIALLPHQSPPAALVHYLPTRFRALALFGRRLPERVVRSSLPASENLHNSGAGHRSRSLAHVRNAPKAAAGNTSPLAYILRRLRYLFDSSGINNPIANRSFLWRLFQIKKLVTNNAMVGPR